jgi:hypothetical protein
MLAYFETFGQRLMAIPAQCDQAGSAIQAASTQEQNAELQHQANVKTAPAPWVSTGRDFI